MRAKPLLGGDSTELGVSRQQDPPTNTRGNQTEAVVCRQGTVVPRERQGLPDLGRCQIVGDQAMVVEVLPLLIGEVEDFRGTYGERDHKLVGQSVKNFQQLPLPEVDQAGSVVDNDTSQWPTGPVICRSTTSRDSLRRVAARTGEISSSPTARQTRLLKR